LWQQIFAILWKTLPELVMIFRKNIVPNRLERRMILMVERDRAGITAKAMRK
jgi:hypothetical protein